MPELGNNCIEIVYSYGKEKLNLLRTPNFKDLATIGEAGNAMNFGIPFMGLIQNRVSIDFVNEHKIPYKLIQNGERNPIHGFLFDEEWQVVDFASNKESTWLTSVLSINKVAAKICEEKRENEKTFLTKQNIKRLYGGFILKMTYSIINSEVHCDLSIQNTENKDIDITVGFHPWFNLLGSVNKHIVYLDRKQALITNKGSEDNMMPKGIEEFAKSKYKNLKDGLPLGEMELDTVFSEGNSTLNINDQDYQITELQYPNEQGVLQVLTTGFLSDIVLFNGLSEGWNAVCIEPIKGAIDGINPKLSQKIRRVFSPLRVNKGKIERSKIIYKVFR